MTRGRGFAFAAAVVLLALAGCGRGFILDGQREAWRHEAEVECLKSGAVKIGVEKVDPIEGPGMCGADFPFKVTALGEASLMSYADDLRPPAAIPNASMPRWPVNEPRYTTPPARSYPRPPEPVETGLEPLPGERMRWVPGPPGIDRSQGGAPAGEPMSISPPEPSPAMAPMRAAPLPPPTTYQDRYAPTYQSARPNSYPKPSDIPDDAVIPPGGSAAVAVPQSQRGYDANQMPQQRELPRLGPSRGSDNRAVAAAQLTPAATLACPLVSALDRWVSEGVQPAALRWFNSPVSEIKQIGSYSCRDMVGGSGVSEHSFGNALDIAGFVLANGRTITVKKGWHGTPEEQGFLHDVQLSACNTFVTVLAPGYNVYHYDHIHVDLMRRDPGYRPCRPEAIPGDVAAAKARSMYANHRRGPAYTGSIGATAQKAPAAIPGADGYVMEYDGKTASVTSKSGDAGTRSAVPRKNALGTERPKPEVY
jgi:hypothetical protein